MRYIAAQCRRSNRSISVAHSRPLPHKADDLQTGRDTLVARVLDAADLALGSTLPALLPTHAAPLLRVLTFSYASGVYCSQDIADALTADGMLRWLADGHCFEAQSLRAFRRRNRTLLLEALSDVLRPERASSKEHDGHLLPDRFRGYVCRSLERWQSTPQRVADHHADAERRIDCAVRCDSATLDL